MEIRIPLKKHSCQKSHPDQVSASNTSLLEMQETNPLKDNRRDSINKIQTAKLQENNPLSSTTELQGKKKRIKRLRYIFTNTIYGLYLHPDLNKQ